MITMRAAGQICEVAFRYDPALTEEVKRLPSWGRGWVRERKVWQVAPVLAPTLAEWLSNASQTQVTAPPASAYAPLEPMAIRALYVAAVKGERDWAAANVMDERQQWAAVLWGPAVKAWFGSSNDDTTLYGLLGVSPASDVDTIKRAAKRLLLQWHPDVCREPDAEERTHRIIEAREILTNPKLRARYDAGLRAQQLVARQLQTTDIYRPPLRSGLIVGRGYIIAGKPVMTQIERWDDLLDDHKRVAVVSWPKGADQPVVRWMVVETQEGARWTQ